MTITKDALREKIAQLESKGLILNEQTKEALKSLENPKYRIAVVGMYQVGKSTLINKVFLGDNPLLKEGRGLCTTAVATDIENGPESKLEVYHWNENHIDEKLVSSISNPSADDVYNATASNTMESRKELAKEVSRVCIKTPNESLGNYTIIDTPGLDDPEKDLLLNTTWRVIPSADVALLVVSCRMLSECELNLLRNDIKDNTGIKRLMVLVSCKPDTEQDEETRKDILNNIKAQLAGIGCANIPVEMYCYDSSVTDIMSDVSEIRLVIRSFLQENALKGRQEKVDWLLRRDLEKWLFEIAAKIKNSQATEDERRKLRDRIETEIMQFKEGAELAFSQFKSAAGRFQDDAQQKLDTVVASVFDNYIEDIAVHSDIAVIQNMLANAPSHLKSSLLDKLALLSIEFSNDFNRLVDNYMDNTKKVHGQIDLLMQEEFDIRKPFVAKIPKIVFSGINYGILWYMTGPLLGTVLQFAGLDPVKYLGTKLVFSQVKKSLESGKEEVSSQVKNQFRDSIQKTFEEVKTAIEAYNQEQVSILSKALEEPTEAAIDIHELESSKADIESILENL